MNITIYIDEDGKVTITDLPMEMLPMVNQLSNNHAKFQCKGGIAGYSIEEVYKYLK